MNAEIIRLRSERGRRRAKLMQADQAWALAQYFHGVRTFAGSFLVAEFPLVVIEGFTSGATELATAQFLMAQGQREEQEGA